MDKYEEILEKLNFLIRENEDLTKFDNLSADNARKTRILSKKMENYIVLLINANEVIEKYKKWLSSNDISLKWNAALNLFPVYPKKCLKIFDECENKSSDKLVKTSMNDVIQEYNKGLNDNNVFIVRLKKIYSTNDLTHLNREG